MEALNRFGSGILDMLFPRKCPFCQKLLEKEEYLICTSCQKELPWLEGEEANRKVDFVHACWSPLRYQGRVPEGVKRFKFGRVRACTEPFGLLMAQCAEDHCKVKIDVITWAPLSSKRLKERGFDQAERLALEVGKRLGLPVVRCLDKVRNTRTQSGLSNEAQRRANALGAYALRHNVRLEGMKVLLIDDVVTSGATLSECARLMGMEGADVYCLTLAQAHGDRGGGKVVSEGGK